MFYILGFSIASLGVAAGFTLRGFLGKSERTHGYLLGYFKGFKDSSAQDLTFIRSLPKEILEAYKVSIKE